MTIEDQLKELIRQTVREELKSYQTIDQPGTQWSLTDLCQYLSRSKNWVKDKILIPNRQTLDVENGGFIRYPKAQGSSYRMSKGKMKLWLAENLDKAI